MPYRIASFFAALLLFLAPLARAAGPDLITINASNAQPAAASLYGLFFEEINHAGDGGLYGELIQNRSFEETLPPEGMMQLGNLCRAPALPHYLTGTNKNWSVRWSFPNAWPGWTLEGPAASRTRLTIETNSPVHPRNVNYLRLSMPPGADGPAMLLNGGYWGVPVVKGGTYDLTFYARVTGANATTDLRAGVISSSGEVLGSTLIQNVNAVGWKKVSATFQTRETDAQAQFFLQPLSAVTLDLDVVSLFPRTTFRERANGLRADLAQMLVDLKPSFLRFPGGCVVEGATYANRYRWKETIGDIAERPGHWSLWGYRSTDGLGYHEFLQLCEDLGAEAMYVCNAGLSCEFRNGDYLPEGRLDEAIQDAVDAVEYALGGADTRWGAERVKNGHPGTFPLKYVEIGNENHGPTYQKYYQRIATALRSRWPNLQLIFNGGTSDVAPGQQLKNVDFLGEHFYRDPTWFFENAGRYDKVPQNRSYKVYVGEFACNRGVGSGNLMAALSEAAFMLGMEKNPGVVKLASYAPLFFNVNRLDWPVNMIGYDTARSFGRSSYYAQQLMARNLPEVMVKCDVSDRNPELAPAFAGSVGLSTWDTTSEFRNYRVEQDGKVLYANDLSKHPGWSTRNGAQWSNPEGAFRVQGAPSSRRAAIYERLHLETGVIHVQARKVSGNEGFQVIFGESGGTFFDLNLGGWKNTKFAIGQTVNNKGIGGQGEQTDGSIQPNRWYDVRVEIGNNEVVGYLDNVMVARHQKKPGPRLFANAGLNRTTRELIVKTVNATGARRKVELQLNGVRARGTGQKITLGSPSYMDENTVDQPRRVVPRTGSIAADGGRFQTDLEPYSITIFRVPAEFN